MSIQEQIKAAIQQAALEITEQLGTQRLIDQLQGYPEQIHRQQARVAEAKRLLEDMKSQVEQAKAILTAQVASERDVHGKPRFSNKEARDAEVAQRMGSDPMYLKARELMQHAENAYNAETFDAQRLDNQFRAAVRAADLVAAQLHLLAGSLRM